MLTPEQRQAAHTALDEALDAHPDAHALLALILTATREEDGSQTVHLHRRGESFPEVLLPVAHQVIREDLAAWAFGQPALQPAPPRKPMVNLFSTPPTD